MTQNIYDNPDFFAGYRKLRLGFTIRHVEEWSPSDGQIAADPSLAEERERPMFLLVAARV